MTSSRTQMIARQSAIKTQKVWLKDVKDYVDQGFFDTEISLERFDKQVQELQDNMHNIALDKFARGLFSNILIKKDFKE